MKKKWCALFCMLAFLTNAQDTIYKRNGEVIAVKVLEVNIKELSYKRMDLLDGPLMIVSKNEIKKIRYATGTLDSFVVAKEPLKIQHYRYQVPVSVLINSDLIKPAMRRGTYLYHGHTISDRNLVSMAVQENLSASYKEVSDHIVLYKTNRSIQYIVGYAGAALGIAGLYGSLIAISNSNAGTQDVLYSMSAASAAIGILISSQIVSFSYKLKRVNHSNKIMEFHNTQFSTK